VGLAALPTFATLAVEWLGVAPVSNAARALAALPAGAAIAFVVVRVTVGGWTPAGRWAHAGSKN
jgi:hypothetical protein